MRGREKVDTVVAPAKFPGKIRDRHHLDEGDSNTCELRQLLYRGAPRSFLRKRADVHFVNDLALNFYSGPFRVRPAKRCRIDYLGRTMRSIGLETRRWIGMKVFGVINAKPITVTGVGFSRPRKISVVFTLERMKGATHIFCRAFFKDNIDT